jgi:chromate transporter
MRGIAVAAFVAIFFIAVPFPVIVATAALIGFVGARMGRSEFDVGGGHGTTAKDALRDADSLLGEHLPPHAHLSIPRSFRVGAMWLALWLVPVAAILAIMGSENNFTHIAIFFSKMAMVTFGGAYAVLAYVAQQAVDTHHWLEPREMLDGLGMAETTPGPLIMVLQFVGFMGAFRAPGTLSPLVAGTLGGLLATWVTFVPCFLWIFLGAPFIERLRGNRALSGAMSAITAAVVGVILNLAIWFAIHTIFRKVDPFSFGAIHFDKPVLVSVDPWAAALALAAIAATIFLRVGMLPLLAATSAAGVALYLVGATG